VDSTSYANLEVYEGTVSGSTTITFILVPRRMIITNDSSSNSLQFRFDDTRSFATLKPTETITLDISRRQLTLSGTRKTSIYSLKPLTLQVLTTISTILKTLERKISTLPDSDLPRQWPAQWKYIM